MTHDINGPSSLFRRELCPGSARLEAQVPDEKNEHSERGDRLHALVATALRARKDPVLDGLDDDDRAAVNVCMVYGRGLIAEAEAAGGVVLIEHKLDLETVGINKGGTLDIGSVIGRRFRLADWKFGQVEVAAPRINRQMHAYGIGLAREFGCTEGEAAIVQPAAWEAVRSDTFASEDLARWEARVSAIVTRTRDPQAPLIPGEHCRYCRARKGCPARQVQAEAALADRPSSVVERLEMLEPAQRRDFYDRLKLAKAWIEGSLETIEAEAVEGRLSIPGYRVGKGRGSRVWAQEGPAEMALTVHLGAGSHVRKLLSPAQAEKALIEKIGAKMAKAVLAELVAMKDGAPRLVADVGKDTEAA